MNPDDQTDTASETETQLAFPPGFVWGAATSSFQIEGATLADGRGESIWDRFCRKPGAIADASNGDGPVNHYRRFAEDVALLDKLHVGAYRFSIAWPRIKPDGIGPTNGAGLDFYERLVDELLATGVEPYPTLYHWDLPQALEDAGGWTIRATAEAFADYTQTVVERLGDRVNYWSTLNEPYVSANHGYLTGEHAPGLHSQDAALAAAHHLLLGHGLAVQRIRQLQPQAQVGIVLNFSPVTPRTDDAADVAKATAAHDWQNRWYIDPVSGRPYPPETVASLEWRQDEVLPGDLDVIAQPIDFLGLNYYSRQIVSADPDWKHEPQRRTAMGWEVHPQSLGVLLDWIHTDYDFDQLLITENGAAMPDADRVDGRVDDQDRISFIAEHLDQLHQSIEAGVPVSGYFVWSLLDNFEWAFGYEKRFGIIEVDPATGVREPKASALWFADVAQTNTLTVNTEGEQP